jgi:hypothetical protein
LTFIETMRKEMREARVSEILATGVNGLQLVQLLHQVLGGDEGDPPPPPAQEEVGNPGGED